MDTDSLYMAISGESIEDLIKPELREDYEKNKKNFIPTTKYDIRTPGLFKMEFKGNRMITLASKCYYADNNADQKVSNKGIQKRLNPKTWEDFQAALNGHTDIALNKGFRTEKDRGMITYSKTRAIRVLRQEMGFGQHTYRTSVLRK